MNLIGNNIKIIRKQIGLTQEELALHIGVTPQAVSRWENGTGMPDISMVVPLAKTLNVSTDYLFGLEKNEITRKISQTYFTPQNYNILIKNVITKLLRKSANKLPTSGMSRYAFTEGAYFSQTACMFAMALGVAPIPKPQVPETRIAAS